VAILGLVDGTASKRVVDASRASGAGGKVAVEAYYSPVHSVGGDFGLVLPHNDELLSLLVCDVSGHGIASALVANRIYAETLHELERKTGPGGLLQRLHTFVRDQIGCRAFTSRQPHAALSSTGGE